MNNNIPPVNCQPIMFKANQHKKEMQALETMDKVLREMELKRLMKTDPEKAKVLIINESVSRFMEGLSIKNLIKIFRGKA